MSEAKKLRDKFEKELSELQDSCEHPSSTWMDWAWAPGHIWGRVRVCDRCEKVLERITPKISESYTYQNNENWKLVNIVSHISE